MICVSVMLVGAVPPTRVRAVVISVISQSGKISSMTVGVVVGSPVPGGKRKPLENFARPQKENPEFFSWR